jgi:hypothetical protein
MELTFLEACSKIQRRDSKPSRSSTTRPRCKPATLDAKWEPTPSLSRRDVSDTFHSLLGVSRILAKHYLTSLFLIIVAGFASNGTLIIDGKQHGYTYNPLTNNGNERFLQKFSTSAQDLMYECEECPYKTYQKYYDYYGTFDYANQWVLAAFEGKSTSFARGNADFSKYGFPGRTGKSTFHLIRSITLVLFGPVSQSFILPLVHLSHQKKLTLHKKEAIQKGTSFMNVWMYVIREMEDALDDCKESCTIENCNDDPVHAWDEAVAFYTGSLEGKDGSGDGKLPYALADKRCVNFNTCGEFAKDVAGTSHINLEIFRQFNDGLNKITTGQCTATRPNKERIEELMAVPLIQGTLRYAYSTSTEEITEKAEAEGAVFAAAVLPLVHACDEDAADTIYKNMMTGQGGTADFGAVKAAFEKTYACLKIRCEDVGGLYDPAYSVYFPGAEPCGSKVEKKSAKAGKGVGIAIGCVLAVALIAFVVFKTGTKSNGLQKGVDGGAGQEVA